MLLGHVKLVTAGKRLAIDRDTRIVVSQRERYRNGVDLGTIVHYGGDGFRVAIHAGTHVAVLIGATQCICLRRGRHSAHSDGCERGRVVPLCDFVGVQRSIPDGQIVHQTGIVFAGSPVGFADLQDSSGFAKDFLDAQPGNVRAFAGKHAIDVDTCRLRVYRDGHVVPSVAACGGRCVASTISTAVGVVSFDNNAADLIKHSDVVFGLVVRRGSRGRSRGEGPAGWSRA